MQTNLIEKEAIHAKFSVTVDAKEVDSTYQKILGTLSRQVKIPGFRPGKAPKGVLVKRIGADALAQEVREALVDTYYPQAVKELGLTPIHVHFDAKEPQEGADYSFEVQADLYPEVTLPELSEIVIDNEIPPLTDEMVQEAVETLQRENATMVPVERASEAGDYLMLETLDKETGEGTGSTLPVDLDNVPADFGDQLVGKAIGDKVELKLANPAQPTPAEDADAEEGEQDQAEALTIQVVVKDIKERELPEADDEFAKTLSFDTWAEVEEQIRKSLTVQLEQEGFEAQREEFIDKLVAESNFEVPQSLVTRQQGFLLESLAEDLKEQGLTLEGYLAELDEKGNREEFKKELEESALTRVKRDLVLEHLLEQRGTTLSNEEFNEALRHVAQRQQTDVGKFRKDMGEQWLSNYRFLLTRDKAVRDTVRELLGQNEETAEAEAATSDDTSNED